MPWLSSSYTFHSALPIIGSHLFTARCWFTSSKPLWLTSSYPFHGTLPIVLAVICSQPDADLPVASHCDLPVATHFTVLCRSLAVICSQPYADLPVASHCDLPVATHFTVLCRSLAVICSQPDADLPVASHCDLPVATHFTVQYRSLAVICSQLDADLAVASHCDLPVATHFTILYRPGDKPLSEPMIVSLPTHICVTRPQWVNSSLAPRPLFFKRTLITGKENPIINVRQSEDRRSLIIEIPIQIRWCVLSG